MLDNNNSSVSSINETQQIILDGKATATSIKEDLKARVARLRDAGIPVGLGTVLVGEDPGSLKYVAGKHKDCTEVGIDSIRIDLPESASQEEVLDAVLGLNGNPDCTGYIVQLPLPKHINQTEVINAIDPSKDADGLHPMNLGELVLHPHGDPGVPEPCTPKGIITLLRRYGIALDGKNVCVIGRGVTVGRTIGLLLTRSDVNATVDLCHTGTVDLKDHVRRADVIISCAGSAGLIKPDWLGDDVVLVDVGVSRVRLVNTYTSPLGVSEYDAGKVRPLTVTVSAVKIQVLTVAVVLAVFMGASLSALSALSVVWAGPFALPLETE